MMQVVDLAACEFEPGSASHVMLGRESGGMIIFDVEAQKPAAKVCLCCCVISCRSAQCAHTLLALVQLGCKVVALCCDLISGGTALHVCHVM